MRQPFVDRLVTLIEWTAAGFLAAVTALSFVSVFLRYFFAASIPDSYDLSSLMLGILIFWGIAVVGHRGEHITVDLLWGICGTRGRKLMDFFSDCLVVAAIGAFAWMMGDKTLSTYRDNVLTYDTQMPVWVFYCIAWIGIFAAFFLGFMRLFRHSPPRTEPKKRSNAR